MRQWIKPTVEALLTAHSLWVAAVVNPKPYVSVCSSICRPACPVISSLSQGLNTIFNCEGQITHVCVLMCVCVCEAKIWHLMCNFIKCVRAYMCVCVCVRLGARAPVVFLPWHDSLADKLFTNLPATWRLAYDVIIASRWYFVSEHQLSLLGRTGRHLTPAEHEPFIYLWIWQIAGLRWY